MNQITTTGLVLSRLNFGEADRIITVLTPDNGKVKLIAKGVRKIKSKLAGGIELFGINSLTFIKGKSDIKTLTSSRLQAHFGNITANYDRTMAGYDVLKITNKVIQDNCGAEYYFLLLQTLTSLNKPDTDVSLVRCWFLARLLKLLGHIPNLSSDILGQKLEVGQKYDFSYADMGFVKHNNGSFGSNHIKILRLLLTEVPEKLQLIGGLKETLDDNLSLLQNCLKAQI